VRATKGNADVRLPAPNRDRQGADVFTSVFSEAVSTLHVTNFGRRWPIPAERFGLHHSVRYDF
jgi:hypothetical protein